MYMYPCHVLSVHTLRVQASSPSALYVDVHVYVTRQAIVFPGPGAYRCVHMT